MKFTSIPDLKLGSLGSTEFVFIALAALAIFALIIKFFEIKKKRKRLKIENETSSTKQSGELPEGADSLSEGADSLQEEFNKQQKSKDEQPESDEFSEMEDLLNELDTSEQDEQRQEELPFTKPQEDLSPAKPQEDFPEIPFIEDDDVAELFSPVESEEDDWDDMMDAMAKDDYGTDFSKEFLNEFKGVNQDATPATDSEKSESEDNMPVEVILHDQVSIEEQSESEDKQTVAEQPEQKNTAVTLVDGSDRVMVSIGEKFEAKYKKSFDVEVDDSAVVEKEFLDGFVFDGRIQFRVSFSEALAKHLTLKDVVEIANGKGSYAGYKVKLDVIDKCNFTCTRTFNYRKVRNAVLVVQLYFE